MYLYIFYDFGLTLVPENIKANILTATQEYECITNEIYYNYNYLSKKLVQSPNLNILSTSTACSYGFLLYSF